jgi:hypothetical protein
MTIKTRPFDYEVDNNGCFNVTSHSKNEWGYSAFTYRSIKRLLHRHVYEEMYGFIPEGLVVRHKCDNPRCINPEHLELGTHADNARDMYERGRSYSRIGESNSCARLTEKQVIEIKRALMAGVHGVTLAEEYGVTSSQINRIKKGKVWASVVVDDKENEKMQTNSLVKNLIVTIDGKTKTLTEWCEELGVNKGTVSSRVSRGMTVVEALKTPLKRIPKRGIC